MHRQVWKMVGLASAISGLGMGCGGPSTNATTTSTSRITAEDYATQTQGDDALDSELAVLESEMERRQLALLPTAPWSAEPLAVGDVPTPLLNAWADADNRAECAPFAPASLGNAEGARARVSDMVEGGWAVEFDRRGMPGMTRTGRGCARCGRGVVGIAGTAMRPEEMGESTAPTFNDGSHVSLELPARRKRTSPPPRSPCPVKAASTKCGRTWAKITSARSSTDCDACVSRSLRSRSTAERSGPERSGRVSFEAPSRALGAALSHARPGDL